MIYVMPCLSLKDKAVPAFPCVIPNCKGAGGLPGDLDMKPTQSVNV